MSPERSGWPISAEESTRLLAGLSFSPARVLPAHTFYQRLLTITKYEIVQLLLLSEVFMEFLFI